MDGSVIDLRAIWVIQSVRYQDGQTDLHVVTGVSIENGRIITCDHGFRHKRKYGKTMPPQRITARRAHESRFYHLEVLVKRRAWDLCILKFKENPPRDLIFLKISDNEVLTAGEKIHLVGHGGDLVASTTSGYVLYTCVKTDPSEFKNAYPYEGPINPNIPLIKCGGMDGDYGFSGGPYVKGGEIVGIQLCGMTFFDFGAHVSVIKELVKEADRMEGSGVSTSH